MKITQEQTDFLQAEGKVILCAVPGSGKTFIVAHKILQYLYKWECPHRGVAALSFTNVASDEIKRQAQELAPEFMTIPYPHFSGTLDSFINNFIFLRFGYLLQQQNRTRPHIIQENYGELTFFPKDSRCYIKGCAQFPERFHWSSNGLLLNNMPIACDVPARPCLAYKKRCLEMGIVTQREVPYLSLLLLQKFPQIANEIAYRFPVIIVDEAQDSSQDQNDILDCLARAGMQSLILVGDPDQALYEWRDAAPDCFIQRMQNPDWQCMQLTKNFRSSQAICNAVRSFSSILANSRPANADGENASYSHKPILFRVKNEKTREEIITAFLDKCNQYEITESNASIAILTRERIHSYTDINNLWQTPETVSLAAATYQWHCSNRREAYRLCEKVLYNIIIGNVQKLSQTEIKQQIETKMPLSKWNSIVIEILQGLPLATVSVKVWKEGVIEKLSRSIATGIITPHNGRLIKDIIKIKTRDTKNPNFLERPLIEYFEKKSSDGYTLSSVHGVKGETFDAILLIVDKTKGTNTLTPKVLNEYPLKNELIRIAYVAMTRPKKILAVSVPKSYKKLMRFPRNIWDYIDI